MKDDGSMPFLDILITPAEDGSLKTSVFRKQTHTDLYLQWTATTTYHQNIVWLVPCTTEQIPSAQIQPCCMKKNNIYSRHSEDVNTPLGHKQSKAEEPEP